VYELFVNGFKVSFLFLFIIKVSTARAGPVIILVIFLSLPPCVAASVLTKNLSKAHPIVSPVADLTDVHVIEGGHISFRLKAKIIEANFTACTLNGRAGYRVNFLMCEASLFEDRECPIFYGHGRKVDMVLFLLVRFLIRIVGRFGCNNSPVIYGDYFQVIEEDGVHSIRGIKRAGSVYLVVPNCMGRGCLV